MAYISKVKLPGVSDNYDIKAKTLTGLTATVDELNKISSAIEIGGIAYSEGSSGTTITWDGDITGKTKLVGMDDDFYLISSSVPSVYTELLGGTVKTYIYSQQAEETTTLTSENLILTELEYGIIQLQCIGTDVAYIFLHDVDMGESHVDQGVYARKETGEFYLSYLSFGGGSTVTKIAVANVDGAETTSNKVTSMSSSSTDTQYPSAKATYDAVSAKYTKPTDGIPKTDLVSTLQTDATNVESAVSISGIAYQTSSGQSLTWDGDTTGKTSITSENAIFSLITTSIPTNSSSIIGGSYTMILDGEGETTVIDSSAIHEFTGYYMVGEGFIIVVTADSVIISTISEETAFTKGIWFWSYSDDAYISAFSYGSIVTYKIAASNVDGVEVTRNKVTSMSSSSTDTQYPSAKATYDAVSEKYTKPTAGIPSTDLTSALQTDIAELESAIQLEGIAYSTGGSGTTITWDGDITGKTIVGSETFGYAQLSTSAPTSISSLIGGTYTLTDSSIQIDITSNNIDQVATDLYSIGDSTDIFIAFSTVTAQGLTFTPGIWFIFDFEDTDPYYVSRLSFGSTAVQHKIAYTNIKDAPWYTKPSSGIPSTDMTNTILADIGGCSFSINETTGVLSFKLGKQ